LQARPITRLCFGGIEGEWTNADFRDGGVAADVVTPLMWSLYESVWGRALKGFLKDLRLFDRDFPAARLFYGRPYWNLAAVKRCAAKLPGFVEREFDRDLAVEPRYSGDGVRTPVTLWNLLRALPTAFAARRVFYSQEARDRELLAVGLPRHLQADLRSLNDHKLLQTFRELIEGTYRLVEENYFRTIFCASIAKLDFRSALGNLPLSYAALVGGLDDLEHFACTHALWQFANWPRTGDTAAGVTDGPELKAFLTQYGHHSRRELDLRVPRWSEDVSFVAGLARQLVGTEDPAEPNRRRRWQFVAELDKARQLLSRWQWRGFEKKLFRLRNYLWLREQMRDLSARVYALLRRFFLELGRRAAAAGWLHSEGDIFYLRFEEIYQIADIARDDRVAVRRQHERMYRDFRAPNEVGRGFTAAVAEPSGGRLTGIGCSAGVVTGCVRVVTALEQAGKLQPGEILVCPFTDPGWTPLLNVAAGVVTENGGLLSHAAVICREYAIPAVLNVAGATRQLRDGQRIRLDGDHGHVDLL